MPAKSDNIAIRVSHLGKKYTLGGPQEPYYTFRDAVVNSLKAPLKIFHPAPFEEGFWALKNISFEIPKGEVIGIIGRNGAGKSTLLKILSRITTPTEGIVEIHGRIGSLLEVGTGFHPELTGRENIFLSGSIIGMKKREIEEKFDAIVKFSEIEKFLDTPVKRYSSGMYVRLAFSVAAHMETEILLVDEVLAVGDVQFQNKCLGIMEDVAHEGRTVLFVSHNMMAVQNLCERAILIHSGKMINFDKTDHVISQYLQQNLISATELTWNDINTAPGNEKVKIHRAIIKPLDNSSKSLMTISTAFSIGFEFWNLEPDSYLNLSVVIYTDTGISVLNTTPLFEPKWMGKPFPKGLFRSAFIVPGNLLNDGNYRVELYVVKDQGIIVYKMEDILSFEIKDDPNLRSEWFGKWQGIVRPNLTWTTELMHPIS